jgi:6-phosphofructokinase
MSQCTQILGHLKRGYSVSPLQALDRWGVFRLAARVAELQAQGWPITSTMVKVGKKRIAAYRLA